MNEAFQLQDKKKRKHRQIHARWMGKRLLTNKPIKTLHGNFLHVDGVKLWCNQCDASTMHYPVPRYFKQVDKNPYVISDIPTSKKGIMLKCENCGHEVKSLKKLCYGHKKELKI